MKRLISFLTAVSLAFGRIPFTGVSVFAGEAEHSYEETESPSALDGLMDTFKPNDCNYMYSPYSIKTALAIAANGADEKTKAELLKIIGTNSIEEYNEKALAIAEKYSDANVELKSANSLWLNSDLEPDTDFDADFAALIKRYYNAETGTVTHENAVKKVNDWCNKSTNGKIEKLIEDPYFDAVIANALYFKGDWQNVFPDFETSPDIFTDRDGKKAKLDFMHNDPHLTNGFYEDEDLKILELDYKGGDTAMYVVLDNGAETDIIPYLDKLKQETVQISLPKFKVEYENNYSFPQSFTAAADYSKMFTGSFSPTFTKLLHKTYINVDEYGTEAAAVTAAVSESMVENAKTFDANKPFEFYITDKATKEILFAGSYAYAEEGQYIQEEQPDLSNLIDALRPSDKNYMYSPFSLKTALALAANGADEQTQAVFSHFLGVNSIDEYNQKANELISKYSEDTDVKLISANSLWLNRSKMPDAKFNENYIDVLKKYYNAQTSDAADEDAIEKINAWCSENTNGKITELINDTDFILLLANALYFKGDWRSPFYPGSTREGSFYGKDGLGVVDYMNDEGLYGFYEDDDIKILMIDYKGNKTAMYFVLDNSKRMDITPYMDLIEYSTVDVAIPKFSVRSSTVYNFQNPEAMSFPNMIENESRLFITKVMQNTFINVDEFGTEAAAVSAEIMNGAVQQPDKFRADSPFEFYIADKDTKEILFAGEYAYPERYSGSNTTESTTEIPSESTSETTEVFTDPTTEATTDVISWQRPDLAVWQLFSGEGEYEYKLFDSNGRVIDKRTINCSDEENSHQPYHGFAENTEVFEKYGEGLYSFSVSRNGKTLVSDFYFYSPKQDGLASAISSETPQDCIAFSLANMFPWNNWEYRITNADKVTAVSSNEYHGKAEYQNPYKTETLDMHYQQLIFRPVKPGVVTFRLTQTESPLDPTVTAEAEYSYIIDSGLNVHVYMPSEGYLSGDADNDGKLTAADSANTLQKALISTFETPVELCDKENYTVMKGNTVYDRAAVMDMNKNGCIDADDSARILQATLTGTVG